MNTTFANASSTPFAIEAVVDQPASVGTPIDWAHVELPDAWADRVDWTHLPDVRRVLRTILGRERQRVQLPDDLPGRALIPKYVLQEFHNLPNGNYSKSFSRGYSQGFDRFMLGSLRGGRQRVAEALRGADCALDLGCGAGRQAAALRDVGIGEVWGLDPSPYLLQNAARAHSGITWVQGVAERTGLADGQFDAVAVCFVFHEIPPHYLRQALAELARVTRPGARLAVLEPSPLQWTASYQWLWRQYGWRGMYYRALAKRAYEPFADAWHRQDFAMLLAEAGFTLLEEETGCPFRFFLAQRDPNATAVHSPSTSMDKS
ncbi:class I SAM-dependent methyltransferase [Pseudomonas sp. PDM14]|uniref:class I SAM-dependent methyltransferase n=1 Tax=Pseudomonas sp. PDM14 TaxID=2769288 RepID=UPI00177DDEED|nr:class I SAM-dependent methyltransferase [Pseudomonas sp. PDM14]MBD9482117.1 class I SAM-dependent methyltransferase [Pseudomonas sp. PDM14]